MQRRRDSDAGGDRLGQTDDDVRAAVRFICQTTAAGVLSVVLAMLWVRGCGPEGADTAACGTVYRTVLAVLAPTIFLAGGLWAFWRTYLVWRARGTWWGWQGAGWFLFALMVFTMVSTAPPIVGPAR